MSIVPPAPGEPRRPHGPQSSGDAWVVAESGERYWGRYGASGLLVVDAKRGVLLQHRVEWSHFGGTWGLPGGALHLGESAVVGAMREAHEEAGVPLSAVRPRLSRVLDLDIWTYTTVVADVITPFEPIINDPESLALEWVPGESVSDRLLHPGFGAAWPALRELLRVRPVLLIDAANVVGSVPDGWWRDRAGAAERLRDRLVDFEVPGEELGLDGEHWYPEVVLVVEGQARSLQANGSGVEVFAAEASGDDAIVQQTRLMQLAGRTVYVVTGDRELRGRVLAEGAMVRSPRWFHTMIERSAR